MVNRTNLNFVLHFENHLEVLLLEISGFHKNENVNQIDVSNIDEIAWNLPLLNNFSTFLKKSKGI